MTEKLILIHETIRQSYARDIGTFSTIVGLWSLGYFAGSPALEWVGVIMGIIAIFSRAASMMRNDKVRMTPAQARAWLDANFPRLDGDE